MRHNILIVTLSAFLFLSLWKVNADIEVEPEEPSSEETINISVLVKSYQLEFITKQAIVDQIKINSLRHEIEIMKDLTVQVNTIAEIYVCFEDNTSHNIEKIKFYDLFYNYHTIDTKINNISLIIRDFSGNVMFETYQYILNNDYVIFIPECKWKNKGEYEIEISYKIENIVIKLEDKDNLGRDKYLLSMNFLYPENQEFEITLESKESIFKETRPKDFIGEGYSKIEGKVRDLDRSEGTSFHKLSIIYAKGLSPEKKFYSSDWFKMIFPAILSAFFSFILTFILTRRHYKFQRLKGSRKEHTEALKNFLKCWHKILKDAKFESANFNGFEEKFWEYQDLIQYHLPKKYKTLPKKWENFKETIKEYEEIKDYIYKKIKEDIINEVNLKYNLELDIGEIISPKFISLLYQQCYTWAKENRLYKTDIPRSVYVYEEKGLGDYERMREKRFQIEEIFRKMMSDKEYLLKYRTEMLKIVKMEKSLESMREEIKKILDELMRYPLLPGTKCEYLKEI